MARAVDRAVVPLWRHFRQFHEDCASREACSLCGRDHVELRSRHGTRAHAYTYDFCTGMRQYRILPLIYNANSRATEPSVTHFLQPEQITIIERWKATAGCRTCFRPNQRFTYHDGAPLLEPRTPISCDTVAMLVMLQYSISPIAVH